MTNHIFIFFLALMSHISYGQEPLDKKNNLEITEKTASGLSKNEKKSRRSAVKIHNAGYGSGTVINFQGVNLVITAQHVIEGSTIGDKISITSPETELRIGTVIYINKSSDIALLTLNKKFNTRKEVEYTPSYKLNILPDVGQKIIYSGYPNDLSLVSIRGAVAGFEKDTEGNKVIIANTFGWFGASGSGVFTSDGKLIGILFAVSVSEKQVLDNIVWVSPIKNIDNYILMKNICKYSNLKHRIKFCP